MKMDCRDSAEYQIWESKDITVIFGKVFKSLDDKISNSSLPQFLKTKKTGRTRILPAATIFERNALERETSL